MNRYIGWAVLTAFFFGIHLSAADAIKRSSTPTAIAAQRSAACAKTHVLSAVTQRALPVDTPCRKNEPVACGAFNGKTAN